MHAMVYTRYGSPDVLQFKVVEKPTPKADEVLVKVHATSVNAADIDWLRGAFLIRLGGLLKPVHKILGSDVAGRVEAVGQHVTDFKVGDEVFADLTDAGFGAFAEYACVPAEILAHKPINLTFEQAASVPSAGVIALQSLRGENPIQAGEKILINGAGGSVGTFAIQLAKLWGAEVTAVDKASKLAMLRSIGADDVIDYAEQDFTKMGRRYDRIIELVGRRSIFDYRRALTDNGRYLLVGGTVSAIFQAFFVGAWISKRGRQQMGVFMLKVNKQDLSFMTELLEANNITPIIDKQYTFNELPQAIRHLESGSAQGKIVVSIAQ